MKNQHGDDLYRYNKPIVSNFSSNVFGGTPHEPLLLHLQSKLELLKHYPEPEPESLERAFATLLHLQPSEVCVTAGATEAIYLIAQAFNCRKSAIWMPTFSEYATACQLHHHTVLPFFTADTLPKQADIIWLCNPNNPTGEVRRRSTLLTCIAHNPHTLFVVDQSYESFTLQPLLTPHEVAQLPNVILIHSLTKQYAIPGIRLGYLTGNAQLLQSVRSQRMPWSVNALAIEAGLYAVSHQLKTLINIPQYLHETARFMEALEATGVVEVWHTDTHFFLCRLRYGTAAALKTYLVEKHGMLIRDAANFEGLDSHYFRLATQTAAENNRLVEAIYEYLKD